MLPPPPAGREAPGSATEAASPVTVTGNAAPAPWEAGAAKPARQEGEPLRKAAGDHAYPVSAYQHHAHGQYERMQQYHQQQVYLHHQQAQYQQQMQAYMQQHQQHQLQQQHQHPGSVQRQQQHGQQLHTLAPAAAVPRQQNTAPCAAVPAPTEQQDRRTDSQLSRDESEDMEMVSD